MIEPASNSIQEYEDRLQRRLKVLKQQFDAGKIRIMEGVDVLDSFRAVQYLPDGSVDLNTVDGVVRSMALAAEYFHDRDELKASISLSEIQSTYFAFLQQNFGGFYDAMQKRELTPHDVAMSLSRQHDAVSEFSRGLSHFLEVIKEFWDSVADVTHAHIEDMNSALKGVFGGDLFPTHDENIASKCGIYTDTLILPDPFLRSIDLFDKWDSERSVYYLIKHGLNLLQYRELACAEVNPPVVAIAPDYTALDNREMEFIFGLAETDALEHAARVFGRSFESMNDLIDYAKTLDTVDAVLANVADPSRVLFDTEWNGDIRNQITRATHDQDVQLIGTDHPGIIVASQAMGRMATSNELLIKARRFRGTAIVDAPTSWQYLVWKLEYDADKKSEESGIADLHVLRGLQSLSQNDMEWLGNIPVEALLELRKIGGLDEIRDILGKGVQNIASANPTNFHRTSDQVFENIHEAFDSHRKSIEELKAKKWKFAGSDIGSWLVTGSLAVTAAATGMPVWGLAAIAADQMLDAPKLKDIPKSMKELAAESKDLRESPVGILFKHSD